MSSEKYIGLDVHQATISVAVMDCQGKVVMESILETRASTLLEFFAGLRGSLFVTFEEGTWAAWLYDLLKPHVTEVLVCNPRKIPLVKQGNKSDKIDARKLAERLRLHDLKSVYHGETGVRLLRELARSYLTIVQDLSRVMNRLKALYRSWAIPCAGWDVYYTPRRSQWLDKIPEPGVRYRAEQLYQQLDMLQHLHQQARRVLLGESRKHPITTKLRECVREKRCQCSLEGRRFLLKELQNMQADNIRLEELCRMGCAFDNFFPGPGHGIRELISMLALTQSNPRQHPQKEESLLRARAFQPRART